METGKDFKNEIDPIEEKQEEFDKKHVLKTIEKVDEKYKAILIMRYVEEMSIKEIGETLEKSENHISVMIHRGIDKLKKILENYNE